MPSSLLIFDLQPTFKQNTEEEKTAYTLYNIEIKEYTYISLYIYIKKKLLLHIFVVFILLCQKKIKKEANKEPKNIKKQVWNSFEGLKKMLWSACSF